ncbi:MAG: hypothetical protein WC809_18845 [Sinimarinibacterium sp.]|jgi:hypothetical protein
MSELTNRLRKAREFKLTAGGLNLLLRRPTDAEMVDQAEVGFQSYRFAQRFVVGWEGVTENDIYRNSNGDALEFDSADWAAWVADRKDLWDPICDALLATYRAHAEELKTTAKNSTPG